MENVFTLQENPVGYLIKPIVEALQEAGGQLKKTEIRDRICDKYDDIAAFEQEISISKKTGNSYKHFDFRFNFAIKDLSLAGFITYQKYHPIITLTQQGFDIDLDTFDVVKEVLDPAQSYWDEKNAKRKEKHEATDEKQYHTNEPEEEPSEENDVLDSFRTSLSEAIAKMSPAKFENFSRALLTKMGVVFSDTEGVKISNDGGIDGLGYHRDEGDFRTTRVVIQCKRYNVNPVGEPEINQFLGAMNKFKADYGVFITNGRFTKAAQSAAREGTPITLIDGTNLIDLVIQYELFITPVTTYVMDDFYTED